MDRQKENMIIVDNSILSFAFDLANGVPINSYMGDDPQDKDLLYLYSFCEDAFYESDLRKSCDDSFKLRYILQSITGKAEWGYTTDNYKVKHILVYCKFCGTSNKTLKCYFRDMKHIPIDIYQMEFRY